MLAMMMLMRSFTAIAIVVMVFMMLVRMIVMVMLLMLTTTGAAILLGIVHFLSPLKFFHNVVKCHSKDSCNMRIIERVVYYSSLFTTLYDA